MTRTITKEQIVDDLQRVAEELDDDNITMDDYREHGRHAIDTVLDRFGKWNEAKYAAGLDVTARNVPDFKLVEGLREMHEELGRAPTKDEMDEEGPYSSTTYQRAFGSWLTALRIAEDYYPDFSYNPGDHVPAPSTA